MCFLGGKREDLYKYMRIQGHMGGNCIVVHTWSSKIKDRLKHWGRQSLCITENDYFLYPKYLWKTVFPACECHNQFVDATAGLWSNRETRELKTRNKQSWLRTVQQTEKRKLKTCARGTTINVCLLWIFCSQTRKIRKIQSRYLRFAQIYLLWPGRGHSFHSGLKADIQKFAPELKRPPAVKSFAWSNAQNTAARQQMLKNIDKAM